jgi:carbon-monoxide dehydrogenase large subunit
MSADRPSARPRWPLGAALPRSEDGRLVMGRGRYLDDLRLPGTAHAIFARSPHAHARVLAVKVPAPDVGRGLLLALTGADLRSVARPPVALLESPSYHPGTWEPLAADCVRYVGEPVAVVTAEDRYRAEDALERVHVVYEVLPPVTDVAGARRPGSLLLHPDVPGNVFFETRFASGAAPPVAAEDVVVEGQFQFGRSTGAAIENRGVVAWYHEDVLEIWASTQVPHILRNALAETLRLPEDRVVVRTPDVGGAFGTKMHLFAEDIAVAVLAMRLGRPVKWVETRRENLLASAHAHEQMLTVRLHAGRDGRLVSIGGEIDSDVGAYSIYPVTAALEPLGSAQTMPGPYAVPHLAYTTRAVATTKCPVGASRGVGQIMGTFVRERLVDMLAARLGLDPAEVRRRNFVRPAQMPYTAPSGLTYDSGDYRACFERALEVLGYEGRRRGVDEARQAGRLVGIGLASLVEYTGIGSATFRRRGMGQIPGIDSATVKILPSGRVQALLGCVSQGQGHATTFAQILAAELSVGLDAIDVVQGDTGRCPFGSGTFASRGVVGTGGAIMKAAARIRDRLFTIAAVLLEADRGDLELREAAVGVRGTARQVTIEAVARAAYFPGVAQSRAELDPGLEATVFVDPPTSFSHATHAVEVEIDRDTGTVHIARYVVAEDCGRMVNPLLVDGQLMGAVTQGLGLALLEELVYDEAGQLLSGTLMDYALPRADTAPAPAIAHLESPAPGVPGGFKGMAESGTIGAPAAIANAIADALGGGRDAVLGFPITRERIWRAARAAPGNRR